MDKNRGASNWELQGFGTYKYGNDKVKASEQELINSIQKNVRAFNGTDTHHYPDYKAITNAAATGKQFVFSTEFLYGLYNGGPVQAWMIFGKLY